VPRPDVHMMYPCDLSLLSLLPCDSRLAREANDQRLNDEIFFPALWSSGKNLNRLVTVSHQFIITGALNIHLDNEVNANTEKLKNILDVYDFFQYIAVPTHRKGHVLMLQ